MTKNENESITEPGTKIEELCETLTARGYRIKFLGFSAIDMYLGMPPLPFSWLETDADIAVLARHADNLRFPGVEIADGAADTTNGIYPNETCYFRCFDEYEQEQYSFPLLSFSYNWKTRRFNDPLGVYPLLREIRSKRKFLIPASFWTATSSGDTSKSNRNRIIMDGALLMARYGLAKDSVFTRLATTPPNSSLPGPETQRAFLSCLLVSPRPEFGLGLLKRTGFLDEVWPELACFSEVDHSKEFHPEGNVWNHTLETFQYRKPGSNGAYDLRLSLALLLHDMGKPISVSFGNNRFDGHAELGARAAARFLERLGFEASLVQDIYYLVKNHMLPAALKRLPIVKTAEIMASPLFPTLMELYRCDESSSFKGLDGYHENSAAYQTYLKNLKNPYRSADGKKIRKREMLFNR